MNRSRTHQQLRERRRRRNGRIVIFALTCWGATLILWPGLAIFILGVWVVLELIGA